MAKVKELTGGLGAHSVVEAVGKREIEPGRVFDLELSLDEAAEGYRAMDERRAIKALLRP